ncbi:hypothetical protein GCM10010401_13360 [Rarobacter faecitabidus]|uniref:hypothetical protein n=1 Tax=Rarobacter faecitabidus TaxID=13243 RepID=UPI00114ECA82|nr:hypothetical protein [Rarobacter faecitabidus]
MKYVPVNCNIVWRTVANRGEPWREREMRPIGSADIPGMADSGDGTAQRGRATGTQRRAALSDSGGEHVDRG